MIRLTRNNEDEIMFIVGKNDIVIKNKNCRHANWCEQNSFYYGNLRKAMTGKEGINSYLNG